MNSSPPAPDLAPFLWQRADAGKVLYASRNGKLNRRGALGSAIFLAIFAAFVGWVAAATSDPVSATVVAIVAAIIFLVFLAVMITGRIQVCTHGVIADSWVERSGYIIPHSTIDPASAMVHWDAKKAPTSRYKFLPAVSKPYPWPAMARYVSVSQTRLSDKAFSHPLPLNVRRPPYSRHLISFRGLHPVLASPQYRYKQPRGAPEQRGALVLNAWNEARKEPNLTDVVTHGGVPVMRWMIGTDQPERLLRELEKAMVSAGIADAAGMTDRALANPWPDLPPRSIPADPALW